MSEAQKGKSSPMKGKHQTEETNRRNSEAHMKPSPSAGALYMREYRARKRQKLKEAA